MQALRLTILALALGAGTSAHAQNATRVTILNGTTLVSLSNPLPVTATFTPSGTQDMNLKQVGGVAIALGQTTMAASIPVTFASNQTALPISAASGSFVSGSQSIGITPTDRTVTSATGSSQTVMAALATRKQVVIQNTGSSNCGVNPTGGTAAIGGAGTITLVPGGSYNPHVPTLSAITAICTAAQPLYAEES